MEFMGWSAGIWLHGKILPLRVTFHFVTRYIVLKVRVAIDAMSNQKCDSPFHQILHILD